MRQRLARIFSSVARLSIRRGVLPVFLIALAVALRPASALANGGTIEVADRPVGPYLIAVMTSPSPLRVGIADLSVLIYLPNSKKAVEDATVYVLANRDGKSANPSRFPATHANATNKFFYAASVSFPASGEYAMTVHVAGPRGGGNVSFNVQVAPATFAVSPVEVASAAIPIIGFVAWYIFRVRATKRGSTKRTSGGML